MSNETNGASDWHSMDAYPTREAYETHQAQLAVEREAARLADTPRAIREYADALKKVAHYERLCSTWRMREGCRNQAKYLRDASAELRDNERRRDAALAVLQATPDGVAWLDAQQAKVAVAHERALARMRAVNDKRIVDEYLYFGERMLVEHTAWRLEERFGHKGDAAAKHGEYERAKEVHAGLMATIQERDLWKSVTRRSQQMQRQQRQGRETPTPDAA